MTAIIAPVILTSDPSAMYPASASDIIRVLNIRLNSFLETQETVKVPFLLVKRIREAILDEVFQPGDRLVEVDLAEQFEVSRQPVREALLALQQEGTVIMSPYKGAMVKPLSVAEVTDIAELRLELISLALKPAYRHLTPADFDLAYDLAKRITRTKSAREAFECNRDRYCIQ